MKSEKYLSDLIQESSQHLRVQPSANAWQKLDRRLDKHQGKNGKVVTLRWLMAVAAVLLVVAGTYFGGFLSPKTFDFADLAAPKPHGLVELVNLEGCKPFCLVIQNRNELPEYYARPVRSDVF